RNVSSGLSVTTLRVMISRTVAGSVAVDTALIGAPPVCFCPTRSGRGRREKGLVLRLHVLDPRGNRLTPRRFDRRTVLAVKMLHRRQHRAHAAAVQREREAQGA